MPSPRIREEDLRLLWQNRSRNAAGYVTTGGLSVDVISPGEPNSDGGPDFVDALVRIGRVLYAGDVEVHVKASSWVSHHHADDPHYNRVILHVAYLDDVPDTPASTRSGRTIPLLLLSPLSDPGNFPTGGDGLLPGALLRRAPLPCVTVPFLLDESGIRRRLRELGEARIARRVTVLEERLREQAGDCGQIPTSIWEQLLYEGVFEGMGYGKNARPFLALARNVRLDALRRFDLADGLMMQSILFGAAGLLPVPAGLRDKSSRIRVRTLRRTWKEIRPYFRIPLLQEGEWLFFRLRPANFPTARIAVGTCLLRRLFAPGSFQGIMGMVAEGATRGFRLRLGSYFRFEADEYWSNHLHFKQHQPGRGVTLGDGRFREILLNTVLPLAILLGRMSGEKRFLWGAEAILRALPASLPNATTRLVVEDILGGKALGSAQEDQGALSLVREWCKRQRCAECPLRT
jgi:hypothetical protein